MCWAQSDTLQAFRWFGHADTLDSEAAYDSAAFYFKQAAEVYKMSGYRGRQVYTLNRAAMSLIDLASYEEAGRILHQSQTVAEKYLPDPHYYRSHLHECLGYFYISQGKYEEARLQYESCLDMRETLFGPNHPEIGSVANNLGMLWGTIGDQPKALNWMKKSIQIQEQNPEHIATNLAAAYTNLAVNLGTMGDWEQSLHYLLSAYELDLEKLGKNHPYVADDCNNIGYIYAQQGDIARAIDYYQQALAIKQEVFGERHPSVALTYSNLGSSYTEAQRYREALEAYQMSLSIREETEPDNVMNLGIVHGKLGKVYLEQKQLGLAEMSFQRAVSLIGSTSQTPFPPYARTVSDLGLCFHEQERYKEALEQYHQAKAIFQTHYQAPHDELIRIEKLMARTYLKQGRYEQAKQAINRSLMQGVVSANPPAVDELEAHHLQASLDVLNALEGKVQILLEIADQTHAPTSLLNLALHTSQVATDIIDSLRPSYQYRTSKALLAYRFKEIFESGIQSAIALSRYHSDSSYLAQALQFAEKSKYLSLMDARHASEARQFAGIPDSLLQQERQLGLDIAYYEKKVFLEASDSTTSQSEDWQETIFRLKEEKIALLLFLEEHYPSYYQLKYPNGKLELPQLQQRLKPNQSLIEYFVGKDSLYLFLIQKTSLSVEVMDLSSQDLSELVDSFRQSIYGTQLIPYPDERLYASASKRFVSLAHKLYQILIDPIARNLTDRVLIVPDGVLGYVPFSALLSQKVEEAEAFGTHPYLIRTHSIAYAFSARLFMAEVDHTGSGSMSSKILAFAPTFATAAPTSNSRDALGPLFYNQAEIQQISEQLPSRSFYGEEASLANFLRLAPNHAVLHIATHGKANEERPDYSFIAFSPSQSGAEPERLYIRDVYNLQLYADLLVLSACETGIGKLQQGEGILSMAQGFAYAGVASLLTTLWSVNDEQSTVWMDLFYTHLKAGLTKDQAVQKASLDYLQIADGFHAHPFFWASYTAIGDMEALDLKRGFPWWGWAILLVLAVVVFVHLRSRKAAVSSKRLSHRPFL